MILEKRDWENPDWTKTQKVHDWKTYASGDLRAAWVHFTEDQKRVIAENLNMIASEEDWE